MENGTGVKTPRRKRSRMETAAATTTTPPPTRTSPGGGLRSTGKDDGARVVWRDSPAEKQIRVSGTGKLAQQEEVQGFVGRLTRASLESPPGDISSYSRDRHQSAESDNEKEHKKSKKKTGEQTKRSSLTRLMPVTGLAISPPVVDHVPTSVSRHILFSPESEPPKKRGKNHEANSMADRVVERSSSRTGESQDELMLLDQIEERLSRETNEEQATSQQLLKVEAVRADTQSMTAATAPAPASSAAYVTPPRHHGTKKISSATKVTPPVTIQQKLEFESPDFTEESWELLDQIEYQASQQIAMRNNGGISQSTQSEVFSQQVLPPAPVPRPMRSAPVAQSTKPVVFPSKEAVQMVGPPVAKHDSPSPSPSVDKRLTFDDDVVSNGRANPRESGMPIGSDEAFKRLVVLEVDRDPYHRRVIMRLLDEEENHVKVELVEDWYDTLVDAGDTVHLILSEQDRHGFFSQDGVAGTSCVSTGRLERVVVDNDHHLIIAHPDILVSPTSVTTSFGCLRRAVLRETLNVSRPTNQKALLGTLKHELFQRALVTNHNDVQYMLEEARKIVASNTLQLIESSLSEETAMMELGKVVQDYKKWLLESRHGGVQLNEPPSATAGTKVLLRQILAVEEMLWSVKWGLKGATDASVMATFSSAAGEVVLPLELKTGSKVYAGVEHQGQVILYTLLLNERYQQRCQDGLLMYVPGIETNRIAAMASHVRGLIIARNKFATAMARVKAMGSASSSNQQQALPPMVRRRRDCERCFQVDECVLHHAAVENGSAESSALEDFFERKVGHLSGDDLAYFRKWNRLIDLEHQNADKHLRALWLQSGTKRERDPEWMCVAQLRLVSDDPAPRGTSGSATMRTLRLHRDKRAAQDLLAASFLDSRFRVDDRVIVSVESIDETKLLVHIARGRIAALTSDYIVLETFQSIPSIVQTGRSVVGVEYTWRIDKDAIVSGLSRAKENLVKLFTGRAPEEVAEGTRTHLRADLLSNAVSQAQPSQLNEQVGDVRRRKLIVHLLKPRFRSSRFADLLFQPLRQNGQEDASSQRAQQLQEQFTRLNIDQQRGVLKVLNSLDYALILGMPGTGKTSTIAFAVKVLIHLGFSVLITSYTHSAVDNLLLKLIDEDIPMIRIGNSKQVHPRLVPFTLENALNGARSGDMSVDAVGARIREAKLVGCTCLGVNNHVLFSKRRFDFCIVDEATQTTEPVVLGPLRCADTFVLVGDHYQLPPLVANAQAKKEGMDVSLFRRLSEAHPEATQQLSYQYRMNSDIMMLANRLVYAEKLKCGSHEVATNRLPLDLPMKLRSTEILGQWPVQVLDNAHGVQFLNTDAIAGVSEKSNGAPQGRGRKLENLVEARVMAGLVQILVAGGVPPAEIAVISPFRAQVSLIVQQIRIVAGPTATQCVEVSTIDKYQGKDKDVVLVSFVRCNAERNVGELLTDWRRINVALTRAKQKLVLVGSKETLSYGSSLFHNLMQLIDDKAWECSLPPQSLALLDELVNIFRPHAAARINQLPVAAEPEPEGEPVVMKHQQATGDIEGLVQSTMPITKRGAPPARAQVQPPVTRDILGEYKQRR